MRKACLDAIYQLAKQDERVVFIGSDLGAGTLANFAAEMPERFIMEGISEANIIGIAAGLALSGKIVYVNTIATFLSRRCYEQIAIDLCLHNANVRLIANGGGLVYAPLGPTHQAIDDIALTRTLPNMAVVAPADAEEMKRFMPLTLAHQGPMYIRLAKGYDPIVTKAEDGFELGQVYSLKAGNDAIILTTGVMAKPALEAAAQIDSHGYKVGVIHIPTITPLQHEQLLKHLAKTRLIVSTEEHLVNGGLGSTLLELLADKDMLHDRRFVRLGLPIEYPQHYGSQNQLLHLYGLDAHGIATTVLTKLESL